MDFTANWLVRCVRWSTLEAVLCPSTNSSCELNRWAEMNAFSQIEHENESIYIPYRLLSPFFLFLNFHIAASPGKLAHGQKWNCLHSPRVQRLSAWFASSKTWAAARRWTFATARRARRTQDRSSSKSGEESRWKIRKVSSHLWHLQVLANFVIRWRKSLSLSIRQT